MKATRTGLVIGHSRQPLVNQGDAIIHIADVGSDVDAIGSADVVAPTTFPSGLLMKLGILSRSPQAYSTHRLKSAALERGTRLQGAQHDALRHRPVRRRARHAVPRQATQRLRRRAPAHRCLDHLLRYGGRSAVRTDGRLHAEHVERHRQLARQAAGAHRSSVATTSACRRRRSSATRPTCCPAIERVGGAPVVIKLLEGTQGIGVILAPDIKVAEAIIETLQSTKQNVLIQQFIAESKGRDIRALVVGDRVVGAMRRTAQGDEFRSQRPPRRVGRGRRIVRRVRADRSARRADHGPARRRRRHARRQRRAARDGGQLVARSRGHRAGDRARHRRSDHRPHRQPGRLPRARRPPAAHRQHGLRRRRDPRPGGVGVRRADRSPNPACASGTSRCSRCTATTSSSRTRRRAASSKTTIGCCVSASSKRCGA